MEMTSVQKLARVLRVLVTITFFCNLIALYLVPAAVSCNGHDVAAGAQSYLGGLMYPGEDDIRAAGAAASFLSWFWVWSDAYNGVLAAFLLFCGVCTAVILWQGRRVLNTILQGEPFSLKNADSLRTVAVCSFLISFFALCRVIWNISFYQSLRPLATYNALFVPIFLMAGLLSLVLSALFRHAAQIKAENDLTI